MAVARTILQMAYYLLSRGEVYHELGAEYLDRLDRARTSRRLVRRLEHLGYNVHLTEPQITPTG